MSRIKHWFIIIIGILILINIGLVGLAPGSLKDLTKSLTQQEQQQPTVDVSRDKATTNDTLPDLPIVKSFPSPTDAPRGLEYSKGYLYVAQAASEDYILKIDPDEGIVINRYDWLLSDFPIGLAWDPAKGRFYISDDTSEEIYVVDENFNPIDTKCWAPEKWMRDMAFDGRNLLAASSYTEKLWVLDPSEECSVIAQFPTPLDWPSGLAWDGRYVWLANSDFLGPEDYIYKIELNADGTMTILEQYNSPGPYITGLAFDGQYLWAVDWVERRIYQLEIEVPRPQIEEIPLDPPSWQLGLPRQDVVQARSFTMGSVEGADVLRQYTVKVPEEGASLLAIVLHSQDGGNLDLYGKATEPVAAPPETLQVKSDFASISPTGEEILVISNPKPNTTYYFIVENREDFDQTFTITAWLLPEIRDGQVGADGQVGTPENLPPPLARYLQTDQGLLSLQQYKLEVPEGAKRLIVQIEGEGDLNLHIRFGQPVRIDDKSGQVVADISAISPGGTEVIALAGNLLQPGTYYIAIEGLNPPQQFTLKVTLETKEGSSQITIPGEISQEEQGVLVPIDLP